MASSIPQQPLATTGGSSAAANTTANAPLDEMGAPAVAQSAVPTLKVMRLQAPHLGSLAAGSLLSPNNLLSSNLLLPDSFGVIHVGETFSAYLGVLNSSLEMPVRGLSMVAQLQTPSRRILLPTALDRNSNNNNNNNNNNGSSLEIAPGEGVDAIISRRLEEAGQHILRVEVSYSSNGDKTLRKFYRFNVTNPLQVTESVTRSGDATCLVSITVENIMEKQGAADGAVAITSIGFDATDGLAAKQINIIDEEDDESDESSRQSAVKLYDSSVMLQPGDSYQYLFSVKAESESAALRGIAFGDELGKAYVVFTKTMGETGRLYSSSVVCPPTSYLLDDGSKNSKFVVQSSGLSVDVAAASAQRSSFGQGNGSLDEILPVTVEPIDPPSTMRLSVPEKISLLVVNHSNQAMNLQIQMRLSRMSGVVVCGPSYVTLGSVPGSGGSCTIDFRLVALVAGLFSVSGCFIVDLTTGMEVEQPVLFDVFAKLPADGVDEEEKKENLL
jgi:hypothetical protein